jgi:hypothetical protein
MPTGSKPAPLCTRCDTQVALTDTPWGDGFLCEACNSIFQLTGGPHRVKSTREYVANVTGPRLDPVNNAVLAELGYVLTERLGHSLWVVETRVNVPDGARVEIAVNDTRILFLQGVSPDRMRLAADAGPAGVRR